MMQGGQGGGGVDLYQGAVGWTGGGYYLIAVRVFLLVLLSFVFSCPLSLLLPGHGSCCVYCFVYFLFSLSPVPN